MSDRHKEKPGRLTRAIPSMILIVMMIIWPARFDNTPVAPMG